MSRQPEFAFDQGGSDADLLARLFEKADQVLIKKLSNNDRLWSHQKEDSDGRPIPGKRKSNQAGVYIPHQERDGGFFPPLQATVRPRPDADEIRKASVRTIWPQVSEERDSALIHYTSKGQETHLTRLPRGAFVPLLPASFLVMGRTGKGDAPAYECLTIDSASDEAAFLAELFALPPDFLIGVFEPASVKVAEREKVLDFAQQVVAAWLDGSIAKFAADNAAMPSTIALAQMAQANFLKKHGIANIDPFALEAPGDALREISRSIEWDLFREYQRRERSVELVRLVLGDTARTITPADMIRQLIDRHNAIDALMLSAAQQRKSRAGLSYEHHIERMLKDGDIPFDKQVILESKKRPDFILPSLAFVDSKEPGAKTGLILSAKTTLRERWKQVEREMGGRRLFLTTVDENIAGSVIEDMASIGVYLVIPESLMKAKETEYAGHDNVLTFARLCGEFVRPHLSVWRH